MIKRIEYFIENQGLNVSSFEKKISASNGLIRKAIANNTGIQAKWIAAIVDNFPQINPTWLLTGQGEMLNRTSVGNISASGGSLVQQGDNNGSIYFGGESGDLEKLKNSQILDLYRDVHELLKVKDEAIKDKDMRIRQKDKEIEAKEERIKEITKQAFERNEVRSAELNRKEEQVDKLLTENFDLRRQNTELTNRLLLFMPIPNTQLRTYDEPDTGSSVAGTAMGLQEK
jgi:hypothetical protein